MSDEKKGFFEMLSPRSAAIVGVVTGVLAIGTIGFIVLLATGNRVSGSEASGKIAQQPAANNNANQAAPVPQVVKSDRPKVELFVMSYCPYGLQMEKAYLPAWELLRSKADIDLKFVSYIMHGQKELEENTRQYCVQKDQNDKIISYLKCFVVSGDYASCLKSSGVNESKLNSCVAKANNDFKIMDKFNDKSTWLSGQYPLYPVHGDLNDKYGVQGSPTLVINGAQAEAGRTPEAVKAAICAAFNNAPSECSQKLSATALTPGFGAGAGTDTGSAECGP